MPIRMTLPPTFAERLAESDRPLAGMWVCSGSPLIAEIAAGSGLDWLLIDGEHSPNGLESILAQLQAVAAYPATPLVRPRPATSASSCARSGTRIVKSICSVRFCWRPRSLFPRSSMEPACCSSKIAIAMS